MSFHSLLFFCFCCSCFIISSIFASNISPGSSLYASNPNQTWTSPNNIFIFGFTLLSSSSYRAALSYFSGRVVIWTAGGSSVSVDAGGALHFQSSGNLQLVNGSGVTVWSSNTAHLGVNSALLDDSGNLVLFHGNVSIWSTFDNPTDTIVPSQSLTANQTLTSGVYSFLLRSYINLTLTWNDSVTYWNQHFDATASNFSFPSLQLQANGILSFFFGNSTRSQIVAYSNDYGEGSDVLRFLRLDTDGNLRMYSSERGSGTTIVTWAALADNCQIYGYCGNMGICSYNDSDPICGCASENFEPVDVNEKKKGCRRKVELAYCAGNLTMLELKNTKLLPFEADQMTTLAITACRSNCLASASCIASSSLADGSGYCYQKPSDVFYGYRSPVLLSTSYVKVCGPVQLYPSDSMQTSDKECWKKIWAVSGIIVACMFILIVLVVSLWWWWNRKSPNYGGTWAHYSTLLDYASSAPVQFSYKELRRSTKGFKQKLGEGGFGAVYKGVLVNNMVVAVKQLEKIEQGEKQFRMEVATISSTHHLNLVRLIGFCSEGRHRLLVYEFMKNGSLDRFISTDEEQSAKLLNWQNRLNVALGTARGITYLHEECRDCIVHCDIKPENILLDENYSAKVSDFGLAKLTKDHRCLSLTNVRGTRGYLAPEWLANLPITSKSDVYSYGMLLLEIVSGRRNFQVSEETNQKKFSVWAFEQYEKDNIDAIVDKRLADHAVAMDQVLRAIQVSFWCIQEDPSKRPTMGKVVQMLEGVTEIQRPPVPKAVTGPSAVGINVDLRSKDSPHSTFATSAPTSSLSSFQVAGISSIASGGKMERASSSLLGSH
ncbi:hypothetical protein K2173_015203 [Erythroxylum novogranatense]|uniref:Receptor-like serine/threonine-protein kinase n=1 Tax=Erythroxylum novogranatense TaxID=1862640 RepID=A0AAV8T196_9ROSI|nr:hypothetical protein K2173_015203 [Erythroxylum novogranatense]